MRTIRSVLSSSFMVIIAVGCGRSKDVDVDVAAAGLGYEFSLVGRSPAATDIPFIRVTRTDGDPSSALLCEVSPISTKQTANGQFRFVYEQYPAGCATLGALPCHPLTAGGSYSVVVYDIRHDRPHGGLRFDLDPAGNVTHKSSL